jgi:hypothetical protein
MCFLGVAICFIARNDEQHEQEWNKNATLEQIAHARKMLDEFAKMTEGCLIEFGGDSSTSMSKLFFVDKANDELNLRRGHVHGTFQIGEPLGPFTRGWNEYSASKIIRIIKPDDPEYKDALVRFIKQ